MTAQILKRLFFALLALFGFIFALARDSLARLWQQRLAPTREEAGSLAQQPNWQRAAIVFVQSTAGPPSSFVNNLLNGLAENNFYILVVTNRNLDPTFKKHILAQCHCLLERFSIARDGAIKAGWDFIRQQDPLKDIDVLAFADDGFFYPRHIASTIPQMLAQTDDWLSLFETQGSSFQIFRRPVFSSEAFQDFWRNYALTTASLRAAGGEAGLAGALLKAGFTPYAYYNAERLCADLLPAIAIEDVPIGLRDALNLTLGFERAETDARFQVRRKDALSIAPTNIANQIEVMAKNDPAHTIGLLCNYLYQAPIKRDSGSRNAIGAKDLIDLAQGFSTDEKQEMARSLRRKLAANFAGMRNIPSRFSRIARSV